MLNFFFLEENIGPKRANSKIFNILNIKKRERSSENGRRPQR